MGARRIHISGDGRMGTALRRLAADDDSIQIVDSVEDAAVVVDYSHPDWTGPLLKTLLAEPRPLLVGTTGLPDEQEADLRALAKVAPVMRAANTGTGINVLRKLVQAATQALPGWDVEILEMHHRKKVDAPSGTAWMLLETAAGGTREPAVPSRVGETGVRTDEEIGIQTLRGGDVVGEHTVYLVGHGERLELTHRAWDRDTFARGGLRAAKWLATAVVGTHTMDDVLGLR